MSNVGDKHLVDELLDVLESRAVNFQESLGATTLDNFFSRFIKMNMRLISDEQLSHCLCHHSFTAALGRDEHNVWADTCCVVTV